MCPIELLQALGLDNEKMHRRLAQPRAGKPILEVLERFGNGQPLSPAHHATKVFWLGRVRHDDYRAAVYEMAFVHVLARMGKLPEDFKDWRSCREKDTGFTVAHAAAQAGTLPTGFKDWGWRTRTPGRSPTMRSRAGRCRPTSSGGRWRAGPVTRWRTWRRIWVISLKT